MQRCPHPHPFPFLNDIPTTEIYTGQKDYYPIKQMQLEKWDGKTWVLFGEVISGESS